MPNPDQGENSVFDIGAMQGWKAYLPFFNTPLMRAGLRRGRPTGLYKREQLTMCRL